MIKDTVRVAVSKEVGDEVTVSYGGDEPVTYKVADGYVDVEREHVAQFLGITGGKEAPAGNTGDAKQGG